MNQKTDYTGTPEEVGARLAADALGPTINEAAKTATDSQVVRMMSGMIAFMAGAVAENFGPVVATGMLRGTADNIESTTALLGKAQ
jgi:NAD/NADP transhydrogenase alpha subunit